VWLLRYPLPDAFLDTDTQRVPIAYFAVNALDVMGTLHLALDDAQRAAIVRWLYSCAVWAPRTGGGDAEVAKERVPAAMLPAAAARHDCGGGLLCGFDGGTFAPPSAGRGGHVAMTYAALAALVMLGDDLATVPARAVLDSLPVLLQRDAVSGGLTVRATGTDAEADVRFVYSALAIAALLSHGDPALLPPPLRVGHSDCAFAGLRAYVAACQNGMDGAFGLTPGGTEGHGGATYCAVASLGLMAWLESCAAAYAAAPAAGGAGAAGAPSSAHRPAMPPFPTLATPAAAHAAGAAVDVDVPALMRWAMLRQRWLDLRDEGDELRAHIATNGAAMIPLAAVAPARGEGEGSADAAGDGGGADGSGSDADSDGTAPLTLAEQVIVAGPGGLTGRPGKAADVCYTWWVTASAAMAGLDPAGLWDRAALTAFLSACQFRPLGGFGKDAEAYSDPMHTFYALAGLALAGGTDAGMRAVAPHLAITTRALQHWWGLPPLATPAA
jgi:prenyltransferase beta subunit